MIMVVFSFVVAAYNSSKTIGYTLESIRKQTFDQSQIEILVIDGGSADNTREVAKGYGAKVIDNPHRLPEPAKIIGLNVSVGRYVCIMDSDEAFSDRYTLQKRYDFLQDYPELKCLSIGLATPKNYNPLAHYVNQVGDPFSCFVYGTYRGGINSLIVKKNIIGDRGRYIGRFSSADIRPIGDSGIVMDLDYIRERYEHEMSVENTTAIYDRIISDTGMVGWIEGDDHIHRSAVELPTYFRKLKFRIVNNVFAVEESGYSYKAKSSRVLNARKYLFPLYGASIVLPIIDGVRMSVNYRHIVFMLHPLFTWYVLAEICLQYLKKTLGGTARNESYGK